MRKTKARQILEQFALWHKQVPHSLWRIFWHIFPPTPSFVLYRVLVLDNGTIAEFDTPANLIAAKGIFYSMAKDAGLAWREDSLGFWWFFLILLTCQKSDLWMYCNLQNSFCSRLNLWYVNKVFYNYEDQKVNFIFLNIFYIHEVFLLYAFFPKSDKHSAKKMYVPQGNYVLHSSF